MKMTESAREMRKEIVAEIPEFPSMPTTALKAKKLLDAAQVDFDELAQAIVRLGTRQVSQMVVGLAGASLLDTEIEGYDMGPRAMWKHALAVAIGSSELTKHLEKEDPDAAFTAGILHDVGKVALANFVHANADTIEQIAFEKNVPFNVAERFVLGIDHAELGAMLMDEWDLNEKITRVIRWHHSPNKCEANFSLTDIVHVANAVTMQAGIGTGIDGLHYNLCEDAVDRLGVTSDYMDDFALEIETRLEKISDIFDEE